MVYNCRFLTTSVNEFLSCRRILFVMLSTAFIVNYLLFNTMNLTIVVMTEATTSSLNWNESQKQNILGIIFVGYIFAKIPAGRLAEVIGPKRVIGYSTVLSALLTLATPAIAHFNYGLTLALRIFFGFFSGCLFPCHFPMTTNWISLTNQSKFIACLEATSIGGAIISFLSGYIISSYGWDSLFYFTGTISLLWSLLWFFLIYDSPLKHPRISETECNQIISELGDHNTTPKPNFFQVPWKKIFLSGPVWAIIVGELAYFISVMTIYTELPSYMDKILKFDVIQIGLYSTYLHLCRYFSAVVAGYTGDYFLKSKKLSKTAIRKYFETISLLSSSITLFLVAYYVQEVVISILCLFCYHLLSATCVCGHYVNVIDISPNFSGTLGGIVYTAASIGAYVFNQILILLWQNGDSFKEWRYFFGLLSIANFVGCVVYLFLCSTKLQKWNSSNLENNLQNI